MFALAFFGLFLNAAFVKKELRSKKLRDSTLLIASIGSIVALTPLNVESITPRYDRGIITGYSITPGVLSLLVVGCLLLLTCLMIAQFASVRAHADESAKKPLRIILRTVVVTTAIALVMNAILPLFSAGSGLANIVSNMAILAFMITIALSVLRYKFLDIRLIVIRAIAYLTTLFATTLLLILPIILAFNYFLGSGLTRTQLVLAVIAGGIALYVVQYLRGIFDKATNKIFFRHYYDPQQVLDTMSDILVRTIDIDILQADTTEVIVKALKPNTFKFLLFSSDNRQERELARKIKDHASGPTIAADELEDDKRMSRLLSSHEIALALELRTTQEEIGFLVLGYKQSGEAYSTQDIRILSIIADEVAIAIQNALRFEEIEKFNETLQQKIDAATRKLRHTNEKLRMLDQTKDDFISMASHQLRTPLTSVKGYVSMVLDGDAGKLTTLQRKLLNQSFISSQRMVYLISDLLNVSRLRTGKFVIEPVPSNLAKVIHDEVEQLQETAKGRNLELTFNKPEHFPTLMLDETKMRQVIMNFIDNAIYYTPSGGRITISLADKSESIEFTVTDTGIGVPKSEQHHLFTKFFRAHNAKRARPDGTGLGLFMAKKVIVAQGGAIIFRSQENKGSTFGFTFAKDRLENAPV